MDKNINILITTAPFGNGHKMVATALKNAFMNKGYQNVFIIDLFTEAHPFITKKIKKAYLKSYNYGYAYSFMFYGVEKLVGKKIMDVYKSFGYKQLKEIVNNIKPNLIINTFPILATDKIKSNLNIDIPIFTIVTDFYVHKLWISEEIDKFYIATEEVKKELEKMNIPIEKAVVTGIPIRESFEEYENTTLIYDKYGFDHTKKIVLISAGAFGVLKDISKICTQLCSNKNIEIAVVCGNNKELKDELDILEYDNLKVFGFTEQIHELYKISTCMITKSGGITLSEALAVQLPLILFKPVPGQEKENALYFESKGTAFIANNTEELLEHTRYIVENQSVALAMQNNMKKIYNKASSETIVEDVMCSVNANATNK
ncbi:glycosyltransferase [Sedimentibacter sp. zth1]|uniref:MGDG synthase family glycosyltransferase n=1 Tax=Sedimentibacter sp. zth1 TaxID=2816908 RepID=UPI001A917BC7|nr:glycosyltransferase [Sedimentibacter sp. zth1]QSX05330.1 glycosyltransferase [Sedimentibacter sp. zth1]